MNNKIKHLVISGGGPSLFGMIGLLNVLEVADIWNINTIESIYGCSSGSWLGVCLCLMKLGLTFNTLEEFIIKRPWDKLISSNILELTNLYQSKGAFDINAIRMSIKPLLKSCGLSLEITLEEFYKKTDIEINMITTNINTLPLTKEIISYKNYPKLELCMALKMSMGLPFLITPSFYEDMCFVDGGIMSNYPLKTCVEEKKPEMDEVLGLKISWEKRDLTLKEDSNMFEFMTHLMKMLVYHIENIDNENNDKLELEKYQTILCKIDDIGGPGNWIEVFLEEDKREKFINSGKKSAWEYLSLMSEKNLETE